MKKMAFVLLLLPTLGQAENYEAMAFERASDLLACKVIFRNFIAFSHGSELEKSMALSLSHSYEMAGSLYLDFAGEHWPSKKDMIKKFRGSVDEFGVIQLALAAKECTSPRNNMFIQSMATVISQDK